MIAARVRRSLAHRLAALRPRIAGGMVAVTLLMPLVVVAQDVTTAALKAAFIYSFIKFTEWPAVSPVSDPLVICVIGDLAVGDALGQLVKGRVYAGRPMVVRTAVSPATKACSVLYVSGATVDEAVQASAGLRDSPVLTISDLERFVDRGGMAQFVFERGQLRFTINAEAVKRSGLKMSSRLLALGQR